MLMRYSIIHTDLGALVQNMIDFLHNHLYYIMNGFTIQRIYISGELESVYSLGHCVQRFLPPSLTVFLRVYLYLCRLKQMWWCGWSCAPHLRSVKSAFVFSQKSAVKSSRQTRRIFSYFTISLLSVIDLTLIAI